MNKLLLAIGAISAGMVLSAGAALTVGDLTQTGWLLSVAGSTPTMSQTVTAGADYLIVTVTSESNPSEVPLTSLTYGGTEMTLLGSVITTTGYNGIAYYTLANPTAGTADLVGTRAGTSVGASYGISYSAWTISGGATSLQFFNDAIYAAGTLSADITVGDNGSLVIASYTSRNAGRSTSSTFFGVPDVAFDNGTFAPNNAPVGASYDAWSFINTDVAAGNYTVDITTTDARSAMGGVVAAVPEPATGGMLVIGTLITLFVRRFRA